MEERGNKTIICSVFFLDIVEYSKKSVSGQISLKERFNAFLSTAISGVPVSDRIILDTGDGAAISFLGDVEDALRAALSMRGSLLSEEGLMDPPLLVRMGVNLGPVRLVKDINGQPNIVGDGINVAQRVMGFAEPGQILVSRSYYDAASRLSQEYAGMFHYEGSRTDKHVREHEVYAIGYPGDVSATQRSFNTKPDEKFTDRLSEKTRDYWSALRTRATDSAVLVRETFRQAPNKLKALYAALLVLPLVLLVLLAVKWSHKPPTSSKPVAESSVSATGVAGQPAVQLAASAPAAATKPVAESKAKTVQKKEAVQKKEVAPKKDKDAHKKEPAKQDSAKKDASKKDQKVKEKDAVTGVVALAILPWGEVYLDGKPVGVSPPLTKLSVAPGKHVIEIKNANFPVRKESIEVKADKTVSISHKFAN